MRLATSWVLIPPVVLLFRADSKLCVCAGMLVGTTIVLAVIERQDFERRATLAQHGSLQFQLFEAEASSALPPWTTLLLSLLLFAIVVAAGRKWLLLAVLLGAVAAAMVGFRWASYNEKSAVLGGSMAQHARRLGVIAAVSVVITSMLLVPRQVKEAQAADWRAAQAFLKALKGPANPSRKHAVPRAIQAAKAGVPKVYLWPVLPRKTRMLVAPPVADKARVIHRSVVIPFEGPYIYTEPAEAGWKKKPLVAHGTPLKVKVGSLDGNPITMVARQRLATSIELSSCRAIQVAVRQGAPETVVGLGLVLANTDAPQGSRLELATQPLQPDGSESAVGKTQTVMFSIPAAELRTFNQIEVLAVREPATVQRGARLEIQSFTLLPRWLR